MPRTLPWTTLAASLRSSRTIASSSTSSIISVRTTPTSTSTIPSFITPSRLITFRSPTTTSLLSSKSHTSSHTPSPSLSLLSSSPSPLLQQLRFKAYGAEYQPSQRKRKRKHGFLARLRGGRLGLGMLTRRRKVGRRFLSH
ncbi:hypothetical protein FFLO_01029 [Filobasidium floriforme]|uniref:Ribosomal protein L34 n=1 Tax=Filobasidium floriforme TaxID=5210 RepID=A0A8K0JQG7_9TREE|nr:ribosomal protein [Filobasidium floriforme]KAG7571065.1 hypothetical protein FFLO_01029 [Filobasidium floriforme]KAH8081380.1 ribosomal protein [Filobasidium floriforme]